MNDLQLNNLVSEIKFFENQAVVSYWEIGKRLAEAKEQVKHGEWGEWLRDNLSYSYSMSKKLIKVYTEFPKGQLIADLNFTQMLELTTVDEETREKIIENENLEDKTVKETKEIIKKYRKETDDLKEENEGLKRANKELTDLAERLTDKEPEIIEKTVTKTIEVIPKDYDEVKRKAKKYEEEEAKRKLDKRLGEMNDQKEEEAIKSKVRNYKWIILNFIEEVTPMLNFLDDIALLPTDEQKMIKKSIENLLGFATNMNDLLN